MVLQNLGWLLHNCSKTKSLKHGVSLHAALQKMGSIYSDIFLSNHLLNMYAKCEDITAAHKVFDEMPERNLVTWSALISGCDQSGQHAQALQLFSCIQLAPNEYIYASAISACSSLLALRQGKQLHARAITSGHASISFVSNSLISMYMNCSKQEDAFAIFATNDSNSTVTYNAMITGFADNKQQERCLKVFKMMVRRGVAPDQFTLIGVLGICTETEDFHRGIGFHCWAIKLGLDSTAFVGNAILTMYSRCGSVEEAVTAFESIKHKDVISWNTIISACSHCGDHAKGLETFRDMMGVGAKLDDFTLTSVLAACAGLAAITHGAQVHAHIVRTRLELDVGVGNSLVNMYAKCGNIKYASSIFLQIPQRNLVSWNTMITALGNHGLGRRAIEVFAKMKEMGLDPDSVTYIGVLLACNHSGLVEEGLEYFNTMQQYHGISPEIEHISCLVDLLGRAGKLALAKKYVEKYGSTNDEIVLGSLLSACRLHGDIEIGEWVACRLLALQDQKLQSLSSSPYVLLSSLYAVDGRWEGVAGARKMLRGSGIKKSAGHSLVEVKGRVEKFTVGDFSHPLAAELMVALSSLNWAVGEVSF